MNRYLLLMFLLLGALLQVAGEIIAQWNYTADKIGTDATMTMVHEKIRSLSYPRRDHQIYLNPPPLLVAGSHGKEDRLQFQLATDLSFASVETITSPIVRWNMFNSHQLLQPGVWYWRFRSISSSGVVGAWSAPYSFLVREDTPQFVTPSFAQLLPNIPSRYPRIYCFMDDDIEIARQNVRSHPEYSQLLDRAKGPLLKDYSQIGSGYGQVESLVNDINFLHQAFYLTQERSYQDKMLEIVRLLLREGDSSQLIYGSDFYMGSILTCYALTYDVSLQRLTVDERAQIESILYRIAVRFYNIHRGYEENHIFDNHFWQKSFRALLKATLVLYQTQATPLVNEMMEYYYELWTARAPASGFNRDGLWINGVGYFDVNVKSLYYVSSMYSYLTGFDFLTHPWFQQTGKYLLYSWLPQSRSAGFGDGHEKSDSPTRLRVAFADFIAREAKDPYAAWYVNSCNKIHQSDFEFRLYRMIKGATAYAHSELPSGMDRMLHYKDCGEVVMHSDLKNPSRNLTLSFRSSPFGSGSHTLADQNSFNIMYGGKDIYRATGYYLNFSDPHNLMSYRHTRAHNSVLVNGIGQPFSTIGYGHVDKAMQGDNILYCEGDASKAYSGISDDPMWIENFKKAGIEQSPANGFGATPLKRYKRHIVLLPPSLVVIYDELEADEPVRWEWLLHSPVGFDITDKGWVTHYADIGMKSVVRQFSNDTPVVTQTDQYRVDPNPAMVKRGRSIAKSWHLTSQYSDSQKSRIITIIELLAESDAVVDVKQHDGKIECKGWVIEAELDSDEPPMLHISHRERASVLSYGRESVSYSNQLYNPRFSGSTVLYDATSGLWGVQEQMPYAPQSTR